MGKRELETKHITHYGNTNKYATAVIKGDNGMTIKADGMTYSYDKGNNILMLTDSYGTTKYKPLFVGELIFPFNQRVENDILTEYKASKIYIKDEPSSIEYAPNGISYKIELNKTDWDKIFEADTS